MRFIDEVRLFVRAGDGGHGAIAWRREKYVPRGGPAGGDGGRGGDVVIVADGQLSTLLELRHSPQVKAEHGRPGGSHDRNGRAGADRRLRVPVGTLVFREPPESDEREDEGPDREDREAAALIGDLTEDGHELVVARGGRGGRGNIHFKSSVNRAPERAEPGESGERAWLRLELRLMADVGIVGLPNVGKSTLISRVSKARPRIADYPFTTLEPQLGVVALDDERSMVVADVPGLIEGAHAGRGLGHAFLRHLERTRVLLHLVAPDPGPGRDPLRDLETLEAELGAWGELSTWGDGFVAKPRVVALNKLDILQTEEGRALLQRTRDELAARGIPLFPISAATGAGVPRLLEALWRRVQAVERGPK